MYPARKHAQRTLDSLVQLLPDNERDKAHVILLAGATTPYRNDTDRELPFRQESNFFYLSACSVPASFLLITYSHPKPPTLDLFIPQAQLADLMWSVPPPSIEEAKGMCDVASVQHTEHLDAGIAQVLDKYPDPLFHTLPRGSALFPHLPEQYTQTVLERDKPAVTDAYLLKALHRARLIKTEEEIGLIRKACAVSSRAHEVVLSVLRMGRGKATIVGEEKPLLLPGEWLIESEGEAEAVFVASCRREGAIHQAYLPIVASSTRAATLHYCCNDKAFAWGPIEKGKTSVPLLEPQVLLIDAGCEWECYASDITRTIPVGNGGRFTAEARDIYQLVREMQQHAMSIIKPGVHWDTVQLDCHRTLVRGFLRLGIFQNGTEEEILKSGVSAAFFPHGVGHSLGLDVHDVPSASKPVVNDTVVKDSMGHADFYAYLRLRLPLEANMVVTVEPGIYFSPHLLEGARESEHVNKDMLNRYMSVGGIRIEDVVVITRDGHENLTLVKSELELVESCHGDGI